MASATDLQLARDGAVVLRDAFDPSGMADALWHALERRHRITRDDRSTWPPGIFGKLTKFGRSGPFASVATSVLTDAIASLIGPDWHEDSRWGQPLITFPMSGAWDVPAGWHIDMPPTSPLPAVRMFAFLSSVGPRGGGTLVITGSHRLAEGRDGITSAAFRADLAKRSDWFRDLWRPVDGDDRVRRYMTDGAVVDGVDVRVVELTGEPGDVVLWHPSLLHAPSANCSDRPRFMLTHTAVRAAATLA